MSDQKEEFGFLEGISFVASILLWYILLEMLGKVVSLKSVGTLLDEIDKIPLIGRIIAIAIGLVLFLIALICIGIIYSIILSVLKAVFRH